MRLSTPRSGSGRAKWRTSLSRGALTLWWCGAGALSVAACTNEVREPYDRFVGADADVQVIFEPVIRGPVDFGTVPFPDALYTSEDGTELSWTMTWPDGADEGLALSIEEHIRDVDGFGIHGPIYFQVNGAVDEESLPSTPSDSEGLDASVFVIDTDTNSPRSFERVPVHVEFDSASQQIVVWPATGSTFRPGRSYAAVVTRGVLDKKGQALGPTATFAWLRDGDVAPEERNLARAYAQYQPVLRTLSERGIERDQVIGLASFRVQNVVGEMAEAKARVLADLSALALSVELSGDELDKLLGMPQQTDTGLSATGGVEHGHLAAMIQGSLPVPQLLARKAFEHGFFSRNDAGQLEVKRVEPVPFTLFLPTMTDPQSELPLVVYIHDFDGDRSDAVGMVDRFAEQRVAVVALDGPFSGLRAPGRDQTNRFTSEAQGDGFGDGPGPFIADDNQGGPLAPYHPFYYRDAERQTALETLAWLAAAREHGLSTLTSQRLDLDHVAVIGVGAVGGAVALMVAALDEGVQTVVPALSGSGTIANWYESPAHAELFATLQGRLGVEEVMANSPLLSPQLSLYQLLLDRAEPAAWAAELEDRGVQILQITSGLDEQVSEAAAARLASAWKLPTMPAEQIIASSGVAELAQANFPQGTDDLLLGATDELRFAPPFERPFEALSQPMPVDVPFSTAADLAVKFIFWHVCIAAEGRSASCPQGG